MVDSRISDEDANLLNMPHGIMVRFQSVEARLDQLEAASPPPESDAAESTTARKARSTSKSVSAPSFSEEVGEETS